MEEGHDEMILMDGHEDGTDREKPVWKLEGIEIERNDLGTAISENFLLRLLDEQLDHKNKKEIHNTEQSSLNAFGLT